LKTLANEINRIGLVANTQKAACRSLVQKAATLIQAASRQIICDAATADMDQRLMYGSDWFMLALLPERFTMIV
jgi:hypothetical protein